MESLIVMHGANCVKDTAIVTSFDAGVTTPAALAKGVLMLYDNNGKSITTAAQAIATKAFTISQNIDGEIISTPPIGVKEVQRIIATKPQAFKGNRLTIGYFPGVNANLLTITPGESYGVGVKVDNAPSTIKVDTFVATAQAKATEPRVAQLLDELVAPLHTAADFGKLFNCCVHGVVAAGSAATVTIAKGSTWGTYSAGTPVVGSYISFQHTSTLDTRTMPKGLYRITSVNTTTTSFTVSYPIQYNDLIAAAVTVVIPADTDQLSFFCESKLQLVEVKYARETYTPEPRYSFESFDDMEVIWDGLNQGCVPMGHPLNVDRELRENWASLRFEQLVAEATANYYSAINIQWMKDNKLAMNNSVSEGQVVIFLERQSLTDLLAGTPATFATNLVTSTGVETSAANSVVNALNLLGAAHGWFIAGANIVANGGKQLTPNVDF